MTNYQNTHPVSDTNGSPDAGSGSAAEIDAELRTECELYYDVDATTDAITVEGSTDGSTWRELDATIASGSVTTGGDTKQFTTAYRHVRVYAGSSFSNSDVNELEVTAKGA